MCQSTVYLDDKIIMEDVLFVESIPEGVQLVALFEPIQVVPAFIRQIDLIKHKVLLVSLQESEKNSERRGETQAGQPV